MVYNGKLKNSLITKWRDNMKDFLGANEVVAYSHGPYNKESVSYRSCMECEVTVAFDMTMQSDLCPECAGVAFIFDEGVKMKKVELNFEYESSSDKLELLVELKDKKKKVYQTLNISGREKINLENVGEKTGEVCIVCFKYANYKKKGELRIFL